MKSTVVCVVVCVVALLCAARAEETDAGWVEEVVTQLSDGHGLDRVLATLQHVAPHVITADVVAEWERWLLYGDEASSDGRHGGGVAHCATLSEASKAKLAHTRDELIAAGRVLNGAVVQDECDPHGCDALFWNGLTCAAGTNRTHFACDMFSQLQTSNGQLWRSPWVAGNDTGNVFSRDMGLGTLVWLTRTADEATTRAIYTKWMQYIGEEGSMCPKYWDCKLTFPFWCSFDLVARRRGLARPPTDVMLPRLGAEVCVADHLYVLVSAMVNELGSALHLTSLDVLLRRHVGSWSPLMTAAINHMHKRQPQNVWFEYLAHGASDALADKVLSQVVHGDHPRSQWSFSRRDSHDAWKHSMDFDFVMLIEMMLHDPCVTGK